MNLITIIRLYLRKSNQYYNNILFNNNNMSKRLNLPNRIKPRQQLRELKDFCNKVRAYFKEINSQNKKFKINPH